LLAIPVLAGSVGYALAELASWPRGLAKKVQSARFLWIDRPGNLSRADAESVSHQSDQGPLLERGGQWHLRWAHHGSRHADDDEQNYHRRP
jgi:hypothetical protein